MSLPVLGSIVLAPSNRRLATSPFPTVFTKLFLNEVFLNKFPAFTSFTLNELPSDLTASDTQLPL